MQTADVPQLQTALSRPALIGALAALVLAVGLAFWASFVPLSAAVIASGQIEVRGKPAVVQSFDGGTIKTLAAQSGDRVEAGQLLVRLDAAQLEASLGIARARLAEALARRARLQSEHQGAAAPVFIYPDFAFALPDMTDQEEGQRRIFEARRALLAGQGDRLAETEVQTAAQLAAMKAQRAAKQAQIAVLDQQLTNARRLAGQGLARTAQVMDLDRARAEISGQIAALDSARAQITGAGHEARITALQARREMAEQVATDLRVATVEIEELVPQILTTMAMLERVEIRAPMAGVVHEMDATPGSVIAPGATILKLIGQEQGLIFDLRIGPAHADQLHIGQAARIVVAALPREAPQLAGRLAALSPTTSTDPATGQVYYSAEVEVPPEELTRLAEYALRPGLPVEAYFERPARSALSYLLDPLTRHFDRAFREE